MYFYNRSKEGHNNFKIWISWLCTTIIRFAKSRQGGGKRGNMGYGEAVFGTVNDRFPVVETTSGKVRGIGRNGIALFRGIPYGKSVEGDGRFLPAGKAEPWEGILDCTQNGPTAIQLGTAGGELPDYFTAGEPDRFGVRNGNDRSGEEKTDLPCVRSENCLVAGVMTPGLDQSARPVLVYIHGGGFATGSGVLMNGADTFVKEQDIVVVYLHHRLNVFGYLYLGAFDKKYESSGMTGILDLVLGLQWVKDNIAAFGGNPDQVTILGESGGAMKICHLLNMPVAKDLFRYAIVESGSGKVGADNREEATDNARKFLANLGITEKELNRLKNFSSQEILRAAEPFLHSFRPVPDDIYLKTQKVPMFAYEDCARLKTVLVGSSEDEMASFMTEEDRAPVTEENLAVRLQQALSASRLGTVPEDKYEIGKITQIVDTFRRVTGQTDPVQIYWNVISLKGSLGSGAYYHAMERAVVGGAPVYAYYNALDVPDTSDTSKSYAWHVSDLALQFRIVRYGFCENASRVQSNAWAAFVRTGNPSIPGMEWPRYTSESQQIVRVDRECRVTSDYRRELLRAFE